ncbi:MAG: SDR family oxidoreductase [Acidimicrobiia bacterium]|nr:SDR family oxidoreductase [Acidimicrobiia bacterium]
MDIMNLPSATMLVTGGNTGIGLETAIGLAKTGADVVFTSRDEERGMAARAEICERSGSDRVDVLPLDLASLASIRHFAEQFLDRYDRLDVLVANAGVVTGGMRRETSDGFEMMMGVNHLGHMALIRRLLDRMRESAPARVVMVSSGAYVMASNGICLDDLQHERDFHGTRVYGGSKLANIRFALELARRLEGTGVTVNALNPGMVATELGKPRAGDDGLPPPPSVDRPPADAEAAFLADLPDPVPAEIGARTSIRLATLPDLEGVTSTWWSAGRPGELDAVGADRERAAQLWQMSERLLDDAEARLAPAET